MGRTTADGLTCNDDVVSLLGDFIDELADGPVLLLGHSYGAYVARGVAARRQDRVLGLALLCPVGERSRHVPEPTVVATDVDAYDELDPTQRAGFDEYFVVRTRATARRYREHVVPGTTLVDEAALERIFAGWKIDPGSDPFPAPTLIVAGRRDSVAGYVDAGDLLASYPRYEPRGDRGRWSRAHARTARTARLVARRLARSLSDARQRLTSMDSRRPGVTTSSTAPAANRPGPRHVAFRVDDVRGALNCQAATRWPAPNRYQ